MNRILFFFLLTCLFGCHSDIRIKVIQRFGGETALKNLSDLKFTVMRVQLNEMDTVSETRYYHINVQESLWEETRLTNGDTIVRQYRNGKGFQKIGMELTNLEPEVTSSLYQQLYYNFIYLLQADTEWTELADSSYQGNHVKIISVKDRTNRAPEIHLFIDAQTFDIVSTSIPENGNYSYFADEFEYETIPGTTVQFPMKFEVVESGKKVMIGKFTFLD